MDKKFFDQVNFFRFYQNLHLCCNSRSLEVTNKAAIRRWRLPNDTINNMSKKGGEKYILKKTRSGFVWKGSSIHTEMLYVYTIHKSGKIKWNNCSNKKAASLHTAALGSGGGSDSHTKNQLLFLTWTQCWSTCMHCPVKRIVWSRDDFRDGVTLWIL